MNIFGVGGAELIVILLIALIVAGPRRMARWAYTMGLYMGKLRLMWREIMVSLQKEMNEAGMDVKLPKELPSRHNISKYVTELSKPYTKDLEAAAKEIEKPLKAASNDANKVMADVNHSLSTPEPKPATRPTTLKPTAPKPAASTQDAPAMGSWGGAVTKPDNGDVKSAGAGQFGAWSGPAAPGSPTRQEAQDVDHN